MKPGAKRACWLCRGLFAGLFFWMGLGGTQGQTPGLTYPVPLDEEHFPDGSFREEVSVYDADGDGSLSVEECGTVKQINVIGTEYGFVSSLEGIRYFYALESLDCSSNYLMSLDLRSLISLTYLDCSNNCLTSLDLSEQTALVTLSCDDNYLTSLNLSNRTALAYLSCESNQLTNLDVDGCMSLSSVSCRNNQLTSLNLSGCTALNDLDCSNNQLTKLDLSDCTSLRNLYCFNNQLTKLDANGCMSLSSIYCYNNQLMSLDLSGCTYLSELRCANNQLLVLDLSCESLCWSCVDMSNQTFIVEDSSRIHLPDLIRSYGGDMDNVHDIFVDNGCTYRDSIVQFLNPEAELRYIYDAGVRYYEADVNIKLAVRMYRPSGSLFVPIDEDHFPDFNFRRYVQENHDANQNGILEFAESNCEDGVSHRKDQIGLTRYSSTSEMFEDCKGLDVSGWGIADLSGIEYFRGLEALVCQDNVLKNLDLTKCPDLKYLDCSGNRELSRIELSNDSLLLALDCNRTAIDLSQYLPRWKYIGELDCRAMQLTELDLSGNPLTFVDCSNNRIDTLSLEGSGVKELYCNESDIRKIDMGSEMLPRLRVLSCNFNRLTELDLSLLPGLEMVGFICNELAFVDFSKNRKLGGADLNTADDDAFDEDSTGNYHEVVLEGSRKLALSSIPGLDASRMARLYGGTIQGDTLTFIQDTVSYYYYYHGPDGSDPGSYHYGVPAGGYFFLYLRGPVQIDETHFPDEAFRTYVAENLDSSANGYLESKEAGIKALDVSGLGIRDLRGIGYFSKLESLDCSANELTSLDLSGNPALQDLNAEGNRLEVTLGASNGFDLSTLPGFDVSKASGWEGGICRNNILTFRQREVTYAYATGYNGNTEDESLQSVRFSLRADREPGTANEIASGQQGRVYAKDHVIHTEGIESEITVFTPSGILLYRGHDKEIPVRNDGVYIVRSGQQVWKVLVM